MPIMTVFRRWKKGDLEFEAVLVYIVKHCFRRPIKKRIKGRE